MHIQTGSGSTLRRIVAVTLAGAMLSMPLAAMAQTAKEQELEARIAELERLVKELTAKSPEPARGEKDKAVQSRSITPNASPGTTFQITGFVKADANFTQTGDGEIPDNSIGRDFYVPGTIPVGGDDEGTDLNAHIKQSRVNFGTDTVLESGGKVSTRFEIDFYGSALGDQRISNTYAPVVRHAYVTWGNWLVGQTWSNFMDVATLPEAADFIGTTDGTTFVRQPQVRWTSGGLSLSAENRETTITPFNGGGRISSDDGWVPDLTARYAWKGSWGHFALAGLLRELTYETTGASAIDSSTWSGAVSASGKFNFGKDDVRWMLLYGGLGRYVGLNFANDAVINNRGDLESIDGWAGFVAYRHMWTDKLRSTISYAMQEYDNDTDYTGLSANKSSWSWTLNLFYSPIPKLDIGAEYRHANRELESGLEGDFDRVQFTTKYSF